MPVKPLAQRLTVVITFIKGYLPSLEERTIGGRLIDADLSYVNWAICINGSLQISAPSSLMRFLTSLRPVWLFPRPVSCSISIC